MPRERFARPSSGSGSSPVWSKDGRELYCIAPDLILMAVASQRRDIIEAVLSKRCSDPFADADDNRARLAFRYQGNRDGQRFLIASRINDGQQDQERTLVMVSDWRAVTGQNRNPCLADWA